PACSARAPSPNPFKNDGRPWDGTLPSPLRAPINSLEKNGAFCPTPLSPALSIAGSDGDCVWSCRAWAASAAGFCPGAARTDGSDWSPIAADGALDGFTSPLKAGGTAAGGPLF